MSSNNYARAVFANMGAVAHTRTSMDNVQDVLDAISRLQASGSAQAAPGAGISWQGAGGGGFIGGVAVIACPDCYGAGLLHGNGCGGTCTRCMGAKVIPGSANQQTATQAMDEAHQRILDARREGKYAAFGEMLELFGPSKRMHIAGLMAHSWQITAVEFRCEGWGGKPSEQMQRVEADSNPVSGKGTPSKTLAWDVKNYTPKS